MKREPLHRSAELPVLEIEHPDGRRERHSILGREVTIGRDRSNRVCIRHHFVSKFHAKIIVRDRDFTLVDLESANKTRVNGRVVTESPLFFGDELHFAAVRCHFVLPSLKPKRHVPAAEERRPSLARSPSPEVATDVGGAGSVDAPETLEVRQPPTGPAEDPPRSNEHGISPLGEIPAFVSWAGPLEASETRRFRAVFFGILVGIVVAAFVTGRSLFP